ncbi:hypothetical protein [Pseudobdellovibrio exovorus]|uniref:Uncharacterized protein n=1 Tax=Pseudobdellovibrio exovorus JSS TaxID=1184267 RepID=M4V729_9BACT|nr:hypothetical protein [Pseudobdellovibrio exovorus]AGH94988.1 hypothetical protein A11Q_770 [Pseudobdellovibrio exovorus JSS]
MSLDSLIQKTPRPVLIGVILIVALAFFIYNEPLKDECGIQGDKFKKNTAGLLTATRVNKKIQYQKILYSSVRCKKGNSIGSCSEYLEHLRLLVRELKSVSPKCQEPLIKDHPSLAAQMTQALQIVPLVAWGEAPPKGLAERAGWLNEAHLRSFCYIKDAFIRLVGIESFEKIRDGVYLEYPGEWPENFDVNKIIPTPTAKKTEQDDEIDLNRIIDQNRPRAYKSAANPTGAFTKDEVYERSLYSIRCDLYM